MKQEFCPNLTQRAQIAEGAWGGRGTQGARGGEGARGAGRPHSRPQPVTGRRQGGQDHQSKRVRQLTHHIK